MRKTPCLSWHKKSSSWRANCGPYSAKTGRRKTVYFHDIAHTDKGRRQALEKLREYIEARDREEAAAAQDLTNPTAEQIVEAYLEHADHLVQRGELELVTLTTHEDRLGYFLDFSPAEGAPAYSDRRARELRAADLHRMVRAMVDAEYAPNYINGILRSVKAAWAWAAAVQHDRIPERLIGDDPFRSVKGPRIPQGAERYASREEIAKLLRLAWRDANKWKPLTKGRCARCMVAGEAGPCRRGHNVANWFNRANVLLLRVAYATGSRPGELCRGRWSNYQETVIDGQTVGVIELRKHKTDKKTGKARLILVPPVLARALARWKRAPVSVVGDHIFGHARGKNWREAGASDRTSGVAWNSTALGNRVLKWRRAAGVRDEVTLYTLRHTWFTDGLHTGLTGAIAGATGGTSERMIEQTYGHIQKQAIAEAVGQVWSKRRKRPRGTDSD